MCDNDTVWNSQRIRADCDSKKQLLLPPATSATNIITVINNNTASTPIRNTSVLGKILGILKENLQPQTLLFSFPNASFKLLV